MRSNPPQGSELIPGWDLRIDIFCQVLDWSRARQPLLPCNRSAGPVPPSLILIGFDTEMPVERKEGVGLALPSHVAPLQPDLAAAGLRDSLALMHFLPPKNSQPNR